MSNIKLDISKAACFLQAGAVEAFEPQVKAAQKALEEGTCPGNDFLGWLHLPSSITPAFLDELQATANTLRENCEAIVVAGIGGSYLGARAVIEALSNSFAWLVADKKNPTILFAGNNIGEDYLFELTEYLKGKKFGVVWRHQYLQEWYYHRNSPDLPSAEEAVRGAARQGRGPEGHRGSDRCKARCCTYLR